MKSGKTASSFIPTPTEIESDAKTDKPVKNLNNFPTFKRFPDFESKQL